MTCGHLGSSRDTTKMWHLERKSSSITALLVVGGFCLSEITIHLEQCSIYRCSWPNEHADGMQWASDPLI